MLNQTFTATLFFVKLKLETKGKPLIILSSFPYTLKGLIYVIAESVDALTDFSGFLSSLYETICIPIIVSVAIIIVFIFESRFVKGKFTRKEQIYALR